MAADVAVDQRRELVSRLLPQIFRDVDPRRRLTVLDVGPGGASSVRFFGGFRCHVVFADLFDDLGEGEAGMAAAGRLFEDLGDVRYDICLFWDFLNYLSAADLREFGRALRRHLHSGSRAHAFAAFTTVSDLTGLRFELCDESRIRVLSERGPTPHRHTNKVIGRVLWPLSVSRAVLLEHNRQELLLAAGPG
ncbi:MAG: hypothetical protein OXH15_15535 [Gammaproteobacteria bacterium]|nr:hypothetical protein [Gammaproteobacteria bacterium]